MFIAEVNKNREVNLRSGLLKYKPEETPEVLDKFKESTRVLEFLALIKDDPGKALRESTFVHIRNFLMSARLAIRLINAFRN